jgi:His/Glu/Gln/Arg/opine family amino acid ABC transporter permease subunit
VIEVFHNWASWLPQLLEGAEVTVLATICTMAIASVLGLLLALIRSAHIPVVHQAVIIYVEIFRGLPTIVILFLAYFGLPSVGIGFSGNPVVVGIIALSVNLSAYLSEVFRAAISAVDSGQMEAALSIGISPLQSYTRIILPQAMLIAVPSLGSFLIGLLKDTSLLSFISVTELMKTGNDIVATTFLAFQVYILIGIMYVILSLLFSRLVLWLERRLRPLEQALDYQAAVMRTKLPPDIVIKRTS